MKELTCIVIGGGYAGINAVKAIRKTFKGQASKRTLRLILIDKNPYHFRKVLLFKPAVGDEEITIPLTRLFPEGVEFVQATVTKIESGERRLLCQDFFRDDAVSLGLDPNAVRINLFNANKRLFPEGPAKVGLKLERSLDACGVTTLHGSRVLQEKEGVLTLSNGETMSAGLCVWTLGLLPNPMLQSIGLPITPEGYVIVDASYRVQGAQGVYSIGDCARIVDPASGRVDGKTCKEATAQAARLGKILSADIAGRPAPMHKEFIDFFCFALGPEQGMVWTHQWGLDIIFTGKLGWRIRKFTWDSASLLK
ncbi:NADH dehydrogenase [compost metagenome]